MSNCVPCGCCDSCDESQVKIAFANEIYQLAEELDPENGIFSLFNGIYNEKEFAHKVFELIRNAK